MNSIYIYGASGHGLVVADIARDNGYNNIIFVDDGDNEYLLYDNTLDKSIPFIIAIGDNKIREKLQSKVLNDRFKVVSLIHSSSIISSSVKVGLGVVIMPNVVVNAYSIISNGVILNTACIIEHENIIEDFVHISPNVALAGDVKVGKYTHIGIGVNIIQGINIGENCIIGGGSMVIKDIEDNSKVVGVPAKNINILITSAGRRVSLVKSFQKTLKELMGGVNSKVFTIDMNPTLSSACQVSDGYKKVPRVTDKNYLNILKQYCCEKNISIVVPTIDTELSILAQVKDEFKKDGIFIAISSQEVCDIFYLKDSTEEFFVKNNLDTPREIDINNCNYPIFAKLNNSSCSIGATIVYTPEHTKELAQDKNYIFQEYIQGAEYTVDVFIDKNDNVISIVPRLRIEVRAGEVNKAQAIKDKIIIDAIKNLCKKLNGAYGCVTIQLFKTENRIVFIEINPRFGGGYPLSYLSGANFAEYLIKDYLCEKLAYSEDWKDNLIMLRYDAEVLVDGNSI